MSANGTVLKNDVSAKIQMKAQLSGMPECKLGLNDKVVMDKGDGGGAGGKKKSASGVDIDDCTFHRCEQLGKFDADRTITFVPPDGEFELMRYRITENVNLPFRVIPVVEEQGATRVVFNIKAIANFSSQLFATNVAFKIPVRVGGACGGRGRGSARVRCHPPPSVNPSSVAPPTPLAVARSPPRPRPSAGADEHSHV